MERRRAVDARIARTARHRPTENQTEDAMRALTRLESEDAFLSSHVTEGRDATREDVDVDDNQRNASRRGLSAREGKRAHRTAHERS